MVKLPQFDSPHMRSNPFHDYIHTDSESESAWMTCIKASTWAPQDLFALASTGKQSSWHRKHHVFLCIWLPHFPSHQKVCHEHFLNTTLDPAKEQGMFSIMSRGVQLFFQLTFPAQISSGMAGQRGLLTLNPYSHSIPWQALSQQAVKISQYLIHCLVSSAFPKNLGLKEWFLLSWGIWFSRDFILMDDYQSLSSSLLVLY